MKVRDVIRLLQDNGWRLVRMRGSHRQFKHPLTAGTVTVAGKRGEELRVGTLLGILRQAGLRK